jgi:hypothetical protein
VGFHLIFTATVAAILVRLWVSRSAGLSASRVVSVSLFYLLSIQWGIGAVCMAIPHIVLSDQVAGFVGWEPGSPFQVELGFASLGISLLGILCIWIRGWFWLAPIVANSVFLLGAAYVHITDIIERENLAAGNAGAILFYDISIPIIACSLFVAHVRLGGIERVVQHQVARRLHADS